MSGSTGEAESARRAAVARFVAGWPRASGPDHHPPLPGADPPTAGRVHEWDTERVRVAARRATVAYPGAVGELLARELTAYLDVGCRFGAESLLSRLVDDLAGPRRPVRAVSGRRER